MHRNKHCILSISPHPHPSVHDGTTNRTTSTEPRRSICRDDTEQQHSKKWKQTEQALSVQATVQNQAVQTAATIAAINVQRPSRAAPCFRRNLRWLYFGTSQYYGPRHQHGIYSPRIMVLCPPFVARLNVPVHDHAFSLGLNGC